MVPKEGTSKNICRVPVPMQQIQKGDPKKNIPVPVLGYKARYLNAFAYPWKRA